jgi:hypothetical protein
MSDAPMLVHLYDDRRMVISPWSIGNSKVGHGPGVYTYSRLPVATCPGATDWCKEFCYALRVDGIVRDLWDQNSGEQIIPPLPKDATLVRIHVSGDFDTVEYIEQWEALVDQHPDVKFWGYTRSWRISELMEPLEFLRQMPNVQLFASVDPGTSEGAIEALTEDGWRLSRIHENDKYPLPPEEKITNTGILCPEQLGNEESCQTCGFCWLGTRRDVTFIAH